MCRERDQFDEAERWYRKALAIDPSYAEAYNGIGIIRERQDRLEDALSACECAAALEPAELAYIYNVGFMLRRLERYADAQRSYRNAIVLDPRDADSYCELAWTLLEAGGDLNEAEQMATKATTLRPDEPANAHALATIQFARGGALALDTTRRWFSLASADERWWTPEARRNTLATFATAVVTDQGRDLLFELRSLGPPPPWRPYAEALADMIKAEGREEIRDPESVALREELAVAVQGSIRWLKIRTQRLSHRTQT
jgi:tetratricopeptide (TPR) repeat protein